MFSVSNRRFSVIGHLESEDSNVEKFILHLYCLTMLHRISCQTQDTVQERRES